MSGGAKMEKDSKVEEVGIEVTDAPILTPGAGLPLVPGEPKSVKSGFKDTHLNIYFVAVTALEVLAALAVLGLVIFLIVRAK
jgi:hypothetical protein